LNGPYTRHGDRIRLAVRVTTKASRDEILGLIDLPDGRSALAIRLAAAPVEGAANRALIALLAKALRIPRSAVRIAGGESARLKIVEIDEVTLEQVKAVIASGAKQSTTAH
jgi:uncharacterized protein